MTCSEFHSQLNSFRSEEKYCDVNIEVQGRKFPCHRVVLAASSEYFNAMFGGCFKEKNVHETTLRDIDVETFQSVIKFMYVGLETEVQVCNVLDLLHASLYLGIRSLEKCCVKFVQQNLSTVQDHIDIFILVRSSIRDLSNILSQYIIKNFHYFYDDERCLKMSYDDLKFVLNMWVQDELPLFKHENLLLDLIIRWVYHLPEGRRQYFKTLVKMVDFERISDEYITFMVKYFKNLTKVTDFDIQNPKNRFLPKKEIVKCFTIDEQFLGYSSDKMPVPFVAPKFYKGELGLHVYVEYHPYTEYLKNAKIFSINKYRPEWILLGEANARYNNCNCLQWRTVSREPFDLLYRLETFEDTIECNNFQMSFHTYSSVDMNLVSSVLTLPPAPFNKFYFEMCSTQYGIIVYSQDDKKSNEHDPLYHYNCELDKWFKLPQTPTDSYNYPHMVAYDDLIYLVGGSGRRGTKPVIALDYRTAAWMELPHSIYTHCCYDKSCILNGKIYVSNKNGYFESFDPKAQLWERLQVPRIEATFFVTYNDMLWIITELNNMHSMYKVATYNPVSQGLHINQLSMNEAIRGHANELNESYNMPRENTVPSIIRDVIVFKS